MAAAADVESAIEVSAGKVVLALGLPPVIVVPLIGMGVVIVAAVGRTGFVVVLPDLVVATLAVVVVVLEVEAEELVVLLLAPPDMLVIAKLGEVLPESPIRTMR